MCVFMYGGGIPIFYLLGIIFLFIAYWSNKILLVKYHRTSVLFNEKLIVNSFPYLKIGLVIHAVSTILMMSNPMVLAVHPTDVTAGVKQSYFKRIFSKEYTSSLFVFYILFGGMCLGYRLILKYFVILAE